MALDSIDREPPPFFRQGLSSLSKLLLLGGLALVFIAADHRLSISGPIRSGISLVLAPLQWAVLLPGRAVRSVQDYLQGVDEARDAAREYQSRTIAQAQRVQQVEQLQQENSLLLELLDLRKRVETPTLAVQVLYENVDPYSRQLVIDKGLLAGIQAGSAVIDTAGVVGQVIRVYPLSSEVRLLTDPDQSIPVLSARTGERFIAFGDPHVLGGSLELRFVPASTDLQAEDLLTTSGIDGVYPPGLHVGRVKQIDRRVDVAFARIHAEPMARLRGRHMLVLPPYRDWPTRTPETAPSKPPARKAPNPKGQP